MRSIETVLAQIKSDPSLKIISDSSYKYPQEVYLVGGYVRDLFLGRESRDFDFAVANNAIKISREIAKKLKVGFAVLDKEHGFGRIVYRKGDFSCNLDFTDFRGKDILEDLLHRDFTINALAINLKEIKNAKRIADVLYDPHYGRRDINVKTIRVISESSFSEDPLRMLRAFSLSAVLNFRIEPKTKELIRKHKDKITSSAFERISEELFKILNSKDAFKTFKAMDEVGILDEIIPQIKDMRGVNQGPYHHLDVFGHSMETLRQMEILLDEQKRNKDLKAYLDKIISVTRTRRALLRLGAFLHDIGKPDSKERINGKTCFHGHERAGRNIARDIAWRLRFSSDERNVLDKIIYWHLRPGYMADIDPLSRKAVYRYFRDTQGEAPAVLLLSIADQRSTRGPLTRRANRAHHERVCLGLMKEFFRQAKEKKLTRLINGYDLINRFKLESGPLIGEVLAEVEEAQATGEIKTKDEALKLAEKVIKAKKTGK
jgi:poly(A) polymerase